MELNMESFLATEKKRLQTEKQQLSARSSTVSKPNNTRNRSHKSVKQNDGDAKEFPAARALRNTEFINDVKCNRSNKTVLDKRLIQQVFAADGTNTRVNDLRQPPPTTVTSSAYRATNRESSVVDTTHTELKQPNDLDTTFTRLPAEEELSDDFETFANDLDLGNISSARGLTGRNDDCGNATIVKENAADGFEAEPVREIGWSKAEKDLANNMEVRSATNAVAPQQTSADLGRLRKTRNEDDMEQWVSDTFYSYFPGFNNEYQKRQNYLRERQLEYQQNLLKHQQQQLTKSNKLKDRAGAATRSPQPSLSTGASTARSSSTAATSTNTNKTDLEIIVNNPNYAPKYSVSVVASSGAAARPGSTRHKLLQDLQHTELANIVAGDGVAERNRQSAESDSARKKDYQRDLMQQIEEKRRSIEALREEERRQEEALTRRLQEQLKTIRLEEELEKEKLRVEKLRFNTEQKRLMREQLLAKLDNDSHILKEPKYTEIKARIEDREPSDAVKQSSTTSSHVDADDKARSNRNKVYKYFSNSARREFRRGRASLDESHESPDFALLDTPQQQVSVERECFHLSEKVCPKCGVPLRTFDATCLRCQRGLSLKLKRSGGAAELHVAAAGDDAHENHTDSDAVSRRSYSLVCSKCDRLYSLCPSCVVKSDVCRACHRQRNVCMNCRRSLCSFCLEEVACGRDTEQTHVNEQHAEEEQLLDNVNKVYASDVVSEDAGQRSADEESSFQVLELNYAVPKTTHDYDDNGDFASDNNSHRQIHNNINNKNNNNHHRETSTSKRPPPPYSLNIERNSIFHPNYEPSTSTAFEQLPKIVDKNLNVSFDVDAAVHSEQAANLDRVRKETDKRLSRYLKNYGDLTKYSKEKGKQHHLRCLSESHDRSTQTTPLTAARRDVVLYEGHNLSMPLLREMPRMTRREAQKLQSRRKQPPATNNSSSSQMMDNLKRRWEIPAVQKHSISTSPPVLTQVGAMRKQLQADRLMSEDF